MCSEKLRGFVHDAKHFMLDYRVDIEHFPLNIYANALYRLRSGSMKEINIPRLLAGGDLDCGEVWGTQKTILEGHTSKVRGIAFSPNDKLLATASVDRTVRLWDLAARKTLHLLTHDSNVEAIAFSPDGNLLACGMDIGEFDWTLKLWDPATGKELRTKSPIERTGSINSIAFSPDGKLLASASHNMVRLWDPATGSLLQILLHDSEAQAIAFSPDGGLLASAWGNGTVKLWDPHTGCEMGTFVAHNKCITAIAFSPDGQLVASASFYDNTAEIWDPATGIKRQTFVGYTEGITSIAFSPDGKLLASTSNDETISLWDPITGRGQGRGTLFGRGKLATLIAFSLDGSLLAWATDGTPILPKGAVDLWELHGHK